MRLLIALTMAFSLLATPNLGFNPSIPILHLSHAATTTAPNVQWIPAGPSTDTVDFRIFTDATQEYTTLQSATPPIDFTDWPLPPGLCGPLGCPANWNVTAPISDAGYFELEFHMGQNNWGCQFNFGNSACGREIRQAFAHGLDKNIFVTTELAGSGVAIDNPVPPSVDLNTPDPCGWDATHIQSGSNCIVNGPGGAAYHLAAATTGSGCTNTPSRAYTPGCGTPDFCAAADHLIAAGLATGKNPSTCVLTGINTAAVTANPMNIFVRSDDTSRLHAGNSYVQFICGLFTGSFSTGCGVSPSTTNIITSTPGPITSFPFDSCGNPTTTVVLCWDVYTAGFGNVLTFDSSLFFTYDSRFASFTGPPLTSPCSTVGLGPSFNPNDYMYLCSSTYDSNIEMAEFAPCLTAPGDPATGQTRLTVTFANCPGASQLSAASGAYKAQDVFGQNAFTIPGWTLQKQYAYLSGWQGGVLHKGNGFTPPGNFFTMLNAWNPSPPLAGTVRQGFSQGTGSVNPFIGSTIWDVGIEGSIWDTPGITNPDSPQVYMDWMTIKTDQIPISGLSYTPPTGTVAAFRYTLRNDLFWHTGQKVTAWDLAFSYVAYKSSGIGPGLFPMIGVKVLSPTQVDLDVNAVGPFTKLFLSNPVLPGRDWVNTSVCTSSAWDTAANNMNFAAANSALTTCIAQASGVTASGVITPTQGVSNVDNAKIQPSYDPVASGNMVGSGPWTCGTGSGVGGPGCGSSSHIGSANAGQQWSLSRYGLGTTPGGSLNTYYRSPSTLALWVWSGDTGVFSTDFLNFAHASLCFNKSTDPTCNVFQSGIGSSSTGIVGLTQVAIVARFVGVNWVSPFDWRNNPPQNISLPFPPVLHEGTVTLNPCRIDPVNGYDCPPRP